MPKTQFLPKPPGIPAGPFGTASERARRELAAGLHHKPARISPKYFYNAMGSKLFEAICLLDEYYLTRAEQSIYSRHAAAIASAAGRGRVLIDIGAGNCAKAALLFAALQPEQYVPVDISADFLRTTVERLQATYPDIAMLPVGLDFTEGLNLPIQVNAQRRLLFYPGSSIGNFTPLQAAQFLSRLRSQCGADSALLIGVDLVKAPEILEAAYNDPLGITSAFNLNVLNHTNMLLDSNFSISDWQHVAFFNTEQSCVEMHLEARRPVMVQWPGGERAFAQGERIHTENSYKYTRHGFTELLASCGFGDAVCWSDDAQRFLVCYARAI
ncbi:MAG: L-histidine N(alpha)-methyltransferase [Acidocella sp.]|nr:L-histidine N(alpha)-methyltransferase [Acidocella sp.]